MKSAWENTTNICILLFLMVPNKLKLVKRVRLGNVWVKLGSTRLPFKSYTTSNPKTINIVMIIFVCLLKVAN